MPVEVVLALGVKLIGLKPFLSGVTFVGVIVEFEAAPAVPAVADGVAAAAVPVPRKLATLLPKKFPIPLPIPPKVARISATGGLGRPDIPAGDKGEITRVGDPALAVGGGVSAAAFSLRKRSASSRSFSLVAILVRAPSNALKREEEPVANAEEPAAKALLRTSRVGAKD